MEIQPPGRYYEAMEIWIIALIFIIAAFGILAMLGYVKNETDRLQLKHFLATAEFKREIDELEKAHAARVEGDRLVIGELNSKVDQLESDNSKLQSTVDKLRLDLATEAESTTLIAS